MRSHRPRCNPSNGNGLPGSDSTLATDRRGQERRAARRGPSCGFRRRGSRRVEGPGDFLFVRALLPRHGLQPGKKWPPGKGCPAANCRSVADRFGQSHPRGTNGCGILVRPPEKGEAGGLTRDAPLVRAAGGSDRGDQAGWSASRCPRVTSSVISWPLRRRVSSTVAPGASPAMARVRPRGPSITSPFTCVTMSPF